MPRENIQSTLASLFARALSELNAPQPVDPQLRASTDPKFGDYQCNAALALARPLGLKPRDLAAQLIARTSDELTQIATLEIAGAGFINIRLTDAAIAAQLAAIPPADAPSPDRRAFLADRMGLPPVRTPQRVVIDYSSPNVAKQMHVGHLRGTILGDCFARVLMFQGHEVVRQNHIGDWGTQFGILIEYYRTHALPAPHTHADVLAAIEDDYRAANQRFKEDADFAAAARTAVSQLQSGAADARKIWTHLYDLSRGAFNEVYRRLGVLLEDADLRGESFYNERLAPTLDDLRQRLSGAPPASDVLRATMREDAGAQCIFLYDAAGEPLYRREDGGELPMIVRKSDGAFLYASTDLAALRYRIFELRADRVVYVVGNEQSQHLQMLYQVAQAAGWTAGAVRLQHAGHGLVLGPDRKRLRTRDGGTVRLRELLDEAVQRAVMLIDENDERKRAEGHAGLEPGERRSVAECVGIAAVKYADLSRDRSGDYVFSWDTMLAMQGNTAPYMLYAYARIRSIHRKAAEASAPDAAAASASSCAAAVALEPAERALALAVLRFPEVLEVVAADLTPHTLCAYLFDLAGVFNRFYESCPVLAAPGAAQRASRLRLCDLAARTLRLGLGLLGIDVIERM